MKYIKRFNEEHNFRDEVEKIYTDKDLVCLIPKTQKMSYIYGNRTGWCFTKSDAFKMYAKDLNKLLILFLFKQKDVPNNKGSFGVKLRLIYDPVYKNFDWGDTSGIPCVRGENDPFNIDDKNKKIALSKFSPELVNKVLSTINKIPQACIDKVNTYLTGDTKVDYKLSDNEYENTMLGKQKQDYLLFKRDTFPTILELISDKPQYYIDINFDKTKNKFILKYSLDKDKNIETKELKTFQELKDEIVTVLGEMHFNH